MLPAALMSVKGSARNQRNFAVIREMCDQLTRRSRCLGTIGAETTAAWSRVGAMNSWGAPIADKSSWLPIPWTRISNGRSLVSSCASMTD